MCNLSIIHTWHIFADNKRTYRYCGHHRGSCRYHPFGGMDQIKHGPIHSMKLVKFEMQDTYTQVESGMMNCPKKRNFQIPCIPTCFLRSKKNTDCGIFGCTVEVKGDGMVVLHGWALCVFLQCIATSNFCCMPSHLIASIHPHSGIGNNNWSAQFFEVDGACNHDSMAMCWSRPMLQRSFANQPSLRLGSLSGCLRYSDVASRNCTAPSQICTALVWLSHSVQCSCWDVALSLRSG